LLRKFEKKVSGGLVIDENGWKQTFFTFTSAFASLLSNASAIVAVSRFFFEVEISLRERFLGENLTFLAKIRADMEVAMVAMFRKMID
jgi:hypothetical protein